MDSSPRPQRRLSRWQTTRRTFVLASVAYKPTDVNTVLQNGKEKSDSVRKTKKVNYDKNDKNPKSILNHSTNDSVTKRRQHTPPLVAKPSATRRLCLDTSKRKDSKTKVIHPTKTPPAQEAVDDTVLNDCLTTKDASVPQSTSVATTEKCENSVKVDPPLLKELRLQLERVDLRIHDIGEDAVQQNNKCALSNISQNKSASQPSQSVPEDKSSAVHTLPSQKKANVALDCATEEVPEAGVFTNEANKRKRQAADDDKSSDSLSTDKENVEKDSANISVPSQSKKLKKDGVLHNMPSAARNVTFEDLNVSPKNKHDKKISQAVELRARRSQRKKCSTSLQHSPHSSHETAEQPTQQGEADKLLEHTGNISIDQPVGAKHMGLSAITNISTSSVEKDKDRLSAHSVHSEDIDSSSVKSSLRDRQYRSKSFLTSSRSTIGKSGSDSKHDVSIKKQQKKVQNREATSQLGQIEPSSASAPKKPKGKSSRNKNGTHVASSKRQPGRKKRSSPLQYSPLSSHEISEKPTEQRATEKVLEHTHNVAIEQPVDAENIGLSAKSRISENSVVKTEGSHSVCSEDTDSFCVKSGLSDRRKLPTPEEMQRQGQYPVKYFLTNRSSLEKLDSESQQNVSIALSLQHVSTNSSETLEQLSSEALVQPSEQAECSHNVLTKKPVGVENIGVSAKARFLVNNVEDMNINTTTLENMKCCSTALMFSYCLTIENHARTVQPTLNFSKTEVTANNAHLPEQQQASTHKKQKLSEKDHFEDRVTNNRTSVLSKKSLSKKDKRQNSLPRRPVKEPLKGGHCVTFVEESAASFAVADVSVEQIQQSATAVDTTIRRPQKLASEKHLPQQKSNPNLNERPPVGQKHANVCRPDLSVNETMVEELDKAEGSSTRRINEERKWQLKVYPLHAEDLQLNSMSKLCKVASESLLYIPSEGRHWKAKLYVATETETATIIGKLLRMEFYHNMLSIEVVRKDTGGKEDGTESKKECRAFLMFDKFLSKKIFDARGEKSILIERTVTLTKLPKAATKDFIGALFPFATEIEIIDSDDPDERKATVKCKTLVTSLLVYRRRGSVLQLKRLEINDVHVKISIDESGLMLPPRRMDGHRFGQNKMQGPGMREYPMGPGRIIIMERLIDRRNRARDSRKRNVTKEMLQLQNQLNQAIKNQIAMLNKTQVGGSHLLPNNYPVAGTSHKVPLLDHAPRHFGGESLASARVIDHHHQSGFGGVSWSSDRGGRIDREVRNEPNRPDRLGRSGVDRMERPNRPDKRMDINVRIDNQPARLERNSRDQNDRNGKGADTIRHKNPRQQPQAFGGGSSSDDGRNKGDRSSLNRSHGSERGTSNVRRGPEYPNSDRSTQRNDRTYSSATHGQASRSTRYGDYPQAEGDNSYFRHY